MRAIDIDHDGRPEILTGRWDNNSIEIWKFNPMSRNFFKWQVISGVPYSPHQVNAADFDKDGKMEIVIAVRGRGVYLAADQGGGNWTLRQLHPAYSWDVIDGDGNLDIFDATDGGVQILYGDGHGSFSPGPAPPIPGAFGFNLIDLNHDGRPDIIGPQRANGRVMAFLNIGSRNWGPDIGPPGYFPDVHTFYAPSAGDVNGDGYIDQAVIYYSGLSFVPPAFVTIFEGGSNGGTLYWHPRAQVLDTLSNMATIGMADLNGDGTLDVLAGGMFFHTGFFAYLGDGSGGFTKEHYNFDGTWGLGYQNSFIVADLDGNGVPDIVAPRHLIGGGERSTGFVILLGDTAEAGPDQTVVRTSPAGASVTLDGSASYDPDHGPLTWTWTGPFGSVTGQRVVVSLPLGRHEITLSVRDDKGAEASDTVVITVLNAPPVARAGTYRATECTSPAGAGVTLDGAASYDPDGGSLTYVWTTPWGSFTGPRVNVTVPLGNSPVTLTVRDTDGGVASDTTTIAVVDTNPPRFSLSLSPAVLWPPNHKLVGVTASLRATDVCTANPAFELLSIVSNEPDNGLGDGDTPFDIQGASYGTADTAFLLRAERSGTGNGRVYTVTYQTRDASANVVRSSAAVQVPKNQGGK